MNNTIAKKRYSMQRNSIVGRFNQSLLLKFFSFSWIKKSTILEIIAIFFIIIFLYTAISKLLDYDMFLQQLDDSPILSRFSSAIALGLPLSEFLVVFLLVFPRWRLKGLYATLFLMVMFTFYVIGILMLSDELPCSCGGIMQQLSWPQHIIFNIASIILAIVGIAISKKINYLN